MSDADDAREEPLVGNLWLLHEMFARAHEQLDATIEMLDAIDGESDPAPSAPPG